MKQRFTLYLVVFIVVMCKPVAAQHQASDSTRQQVDFYVVKKKSERVSEIARKLKTDAFLLCSMNDIASVDSVLTKGQKIIVRAGIKNNSNPKNEDDTTTMQPAEKNKEVLKPVPLVAQPPVDTELIQNRILLTEATLDLNKTLLQGIQASLDSLNVKDNGLIDEKNISLTIHRMQRQRDKAMLTPVLMHMQDSLKTEIKKEEREKSELENTLNGVVATKPVQNTLITNQVVKDSVPQQTNVTQTAASVMDSSVKFEARHVIDDTDAVAATPVQHNEKQTPAEPVHVRPVIEANPSNPAPVTAPVMHWETAKAIYYNDDTISDAPNGAAALSEKQTVKNRTDTIAYTPGAVVKDTEKIPIPTSVEARIIRAKYYYTRALKASSEKNYNTAVSYLKKSIDLYPRYYDAWLALGEADAHSGLNTKALNEFKYCKTMDSSSAVLFYKIGIVQLKLKDKTEAFNNFNVSLKLDHDYIPAIMSRAKEYVDRGMYRIAIKEYNRVLQLDPSYHTVYKQKALAEYDVKSYSAAIDDFTRFLIFNETDASVYYHRGMAKLELKQKSDACIDFSFSAKLGYKAAAKALAAHCK